MESVRLQKFFTDCGVLSRRSAEDEIRAGHVTVNGEVASIGTKVDPEKDIVLWNGERVRLVISPKHYILLYKPRGIVTTLSDERGRTTVADLVADLSVRVYPVGRLDMDSDGLLLLTDDGALTERLTHPRHEIPKRYHVTVGGVVTPAQLGALNNSFLLDGYNTRPARVSVVRAEGGETVLEFELYEGRNRQIRRMCDQVGLRVKRLTRVAIGRIGIGDLTPGRYRALNEDEIAYLKGEDATAAPKASKTPKTPKATKATAKKETAKAEDAEKKAADGTKKASDHTVTTASVRATTKRMLGTIGDVSKEIVKRTAAATARVARSAKAAREAKAAKDKAEETATPERTAKKASTAKKHAPAKKEQDV